MDQHRTPRGDRRQLVTAVWIADQAAFEELLDAVVLE